MRYLLSEVHHFQKIAGLLRENDIDLSDTPKFGGPKYLFATVDEDTTSGQQTFLFDSSLPFIEAFKKAYVSWSSLDANNQGEVEMHEEEFEENVRSNVKVKGNVLSYDNGDGLSFYFIKL